MTIMSGHTVEFACLHTVDPWEELIAPAYRRMPLMQTVTIQAADSSWPRNAQWTIAGMAILVDHRPVWTNRVPAPGPIMLGPGDAFQCTIDDNILQLIDGILRLFPSSLPEAETCGWCGYADGGHAPRCVFDPHWSL